MTIDNIDEIINEEDIESNANPSKSSKQKSLSSINYISGKY